ncbi:MAG: leucine-rich repeat domain-containing protein, partial [Clostridia bacterium]|nr:leucine-rich repeat domain-containing protein [Clostridia bacterium]
MTKKLLSILLAVIMTFSIMPIAVFSEDDITFYLTYEVNNGAVTITGCDTSISGDIVIPDTIEGYPVTVIGDSAFKLCTALTSVIIPDNVTTIGYQAFYGCSSLENITLPDSLTSIGGYALSYTAIKTIKLPDSITSIGCQTFRCCYSLEEVILPKNLKECEGPFMDCVSLSFDGIILPDGIEVIPATLYTRLQVSLKSVTLPESVKTIEAQAFESCALLESVNLSENVEYIGANAFADCWVLNDITLYNKNVVLEEKSIGYSYIFVNGDKEEFSFALTEAWNYALSENPDEEKLNELYAKVDSMITEYTELQPDPNFTIYGYKGSTAETYANENNLKFVALCEHNYVDTVITPATYSQAGEGGEVCEHCGDVLSTYEIPMLEIEDSEEMEDADTGVSVIFPDSAFENADVEIEVTPVTDGDAYALVGEKHGRDKVTMFDINVLVDGEKVQPEGKILVKIPVPKGYDHTKCVVYYVSDDGTIERLKTFRNKDGYIYFETDHFSYYAVVEET